MRPGALIGPVILIGLGVLFLLNNMGLDFPIGWLFGTFWPLILIAVGLVQLAGGRQGSMAGGIVLITLGSLFMLQQVWDISFRHTWPVLLIAVGAIGLLKAMLGPVFSFGRAGRFMRGGLPR